MRHQHHHNTDNSSQLAVVAAVSAVAGAMLGVLFAPRKGESTRNAVRAKLQEMKSKASIPEVDTEIANEVAEKVTQNVNSTAAMAVKAVTKKDTPLKPKPRVRATKKANKPDANS